MFLIRALIIRQPDWGFARETRFARVFRDLTGERI